ncbi:MAG: hypothetical protein LBO69_05175 [Ignavibacteria bacterium]|jgi:hypothetical protein|nr:hypothetical protein [Ignavibacteria bacterium]
MNFELTPEIKTLLKQWINGIYSIDKQGLINVEGDVHIKNYEGTELPVRFGIVRGRFSCRDSKITSLAGFPSEVTQMFVCSFNRALKSLDGCPKKVGNSFRCWNNLKRFSKSEIKRRCRVKGDIAVKRRNLDRNYIRTYVDRPQEFKVFSQFDLWIPEGYGLHKPA